MSKTEKDLELQRYANACALWMECQKGERDSYVNYLTVAAYQRIMLMHKGLGAQAEVVRRRYPEVYELT